MPALPEAAAKTYANARSMIEKLEVSLGPSFEVSFDAQYQLYHPQREQNTVHERVVTHPEYTLAIFEGDSERSHCSAADTLFCGPLLYAGVESRVRLSPSCSTPLTIAVEQRFLQPQSLSAGMSSPPIPTATPAMSSIHIPDASVIASEAYMYLLVAEHVAPSARAARSVFDLNPAWAAQYPKGRFEAVSDISVPSALASGTYTDLLIAERIAQSAAARRSLLDINLIWAAQYPEDHQTYLSCLELQRTSGRSQKLSRVVQAVRFVTSLNRRTSPIARSSISRATIVLNPIETGDKGNVLANEETKREPQSAADWVRTVEAHSSPLSSNEVTIVGSRLRESRRSRFCLLSPKTWRRLIHGRSPLDEPEPEPGEVDFYPSSTVGDLSYSVQSAYHYMYADMRPRTKYTGTSVDESQGQFPLKPAHVPLRSCHRGSPSPCLEHLRSAGLATGPCLEEPISSSELPQALSTGKPVTVRRKRRVKVLAPRVADALLKKDNVHQNMRLVWRAMAAKKAERKLLRRRSYSVCGPLIVQGSLVMDAATSSVESRLVGTDSGTVAPLPAAGWRKLKMILSLVPKRY